MTNAQSRILPTNVVLDRVCMSKTSLYRLIEKGEFPKPIPVGRQRIGFLEAEVNAWIDARIKDREEGLGVVARRQRALRAIGGRRG